MISKFSKRVCAQNHHMKSYLGFQSSLEEGWIQLKKGKIQLYRFFCFSKRHSILEQNAHYLLYYTSYGCIMFIAIFTCNYLKIYTEFQRTVQFLSYYKRWYAPIITSALSVVYPVSWTTTETLFHIRDESMAPNLRKLLPFCAQQDLQCVVTKFPSKHAQLSGSISVSGYHQPVGTQSGGDRNPELEKLECSTLWQAF